MKLAPLRRPLIPVVLGATDLALGILLVAEPISRVSAPSFSAAQSVAPMRAWGAVLLVLACLIIVRTAMDRHSGYSLSLAAGWHAFFVVALASAAIQNPKAGLTGGAIYTSFVVLHLLAAWRKIK